MSALRSGQLLVESRIIQAKMFQMMLVSESLICIPSLLGMVSSHQNPYIRISLIAITFCFSCSILTLIFTSIFFSGFITITSSPFTREARGLLLYLFDLNFSCSWLPAISFLLKKF